MAFVGFGEILPGLFKLLLGEVFRNPVPVLIGQEELSILCMNAHSNKKKSLEEIMRAISFGDKLDDADAEQLVGFIRSGQIRLDIAKSAMVPYFLKKFGQAANLVDQLDQIISPGISEMQLGQLTREEAIRIKEDARRDLELYRKAIESITKQPPTTSPETMSEALREMDSPADHGAVLKISPERRERVRTALTIVSERINRSGRAQMAIGIMVKTKPSTKSN